MQGDSKGRYSEKVTETRRQAGYEKAKDQQTIPAHWKKDDYNDYNDYNREKQRPNNDAQTTYSRGYYLHNEKKRFSTHKISKNHLEASRIAKHSTPQNVWEITSNEDWQRPNEVGSSSSPAHETQGQEERSPGHETTYPDQWLSTYDEQAQDAMIEYNKYYGISQPRQRHWADDI